MDIQRHVDVIDPGDWTKPIHIIGAGATGSWVTLFLSKLGFSDVRVHDFDDIEEHNLPNQCFKHEQVGKNKALAISEIATEFGTPVKHTNQEVTGEDLSGIVVVLTDSMSSRKEIFDNVKLKHRVDYLIETRMDYNNGRIYCFNPQVLADVQRYNSTLYSDEEADLASGPSACGASQTVIGTSAYIASLVIWRIINYVNEVKNPFEMMFDLENVINIEEE